MTIDPRRTVHPAAATHLPAAMRSLAAAAVAVLLAVGLAAPAEAESVVLRGGKTLDAEQVTFHAEGIEVVLRRDGGVARVRLRLDKLDPNAVLGLWDRTHDPKDGAARLASAKLAARLGKRVEAAARFLDAARLDNALEDARDTGLAGLRALEAGEAFEVLEVRVRAGRDPRAAVALARSLLDGPHANALTAGRTRRIRALARLAEAMVARDAARAAALAAPTPTPKPAPVVAGKDVPAGKDAAAAKAPAPSPGGVLGSINKRLDSYIARADVSREAAANPDVRPRQALRHLEKAADAYLLARRLVREAPSALAADLAEVGDDLRLALVTTYLEIAELYRQEQYYDAARARVRAALILDPGNEDAWTQRRLIEDDLARPQTTSDGYYEPAVRLYRFSPSPFWTPYIYSGPYHGSRRARGGLSGYYSGGTFGFQFGSHRSSSRRGTTRVVGRRR